MKHRAIRLGQRWAALALLAVGLLGPRVPAQAWREPVVSVRLAAAGLGVANRQGAPTAPSQVGQEIDADTAPPVEQRRHLSRRYRVPAAGRPFALEARYGRVQINTWAKAEIKVDAELVARSETDAGARQVLDALGVQWLDYDARTGGILVSSQFGPMLRGRSGCSGRRYEINYTVWLPAATALRVANGFGTVTVVDDLKGPTNLAVDYGDLRTARLEGPRNAVRIANGSCIIPFAGRASIEASYARLRVDAGQAVDLRTNYADVEVGTVENLVVHSKYGDVALGTVRSLRGSSGFSRVSVEKISEELDMALRYCPDFEVRDTGPNFRRITLDGGYSTIRLGFAETPAFRFDVSTEQGQLLVDPALVRVLSEAHGAQSSDVLGVFGRATPARGAGNVNVRVRYGTVRFSR